MKLGFIGTGNMASAIMGGVINKGLIPANEIIGSDLFAPSREKAANVSDDCTSLCAGAS